MLSIMLVTALSLSSCDMVEDMLGLSGETGGDVGNVPEISGTYVRVTGTPAPEITFEGNSAFVKMGRRTMSGTYQIRELEDGVYEIKFDFGNSTTPIGGIGSGTYPFSAGNHKGVDYIMLFGSRFDKQ